MKILLYSLALVCAYVIATIAQDKVDIKDENQQHLRIANLRELAYTFTERGFRFAFNLSDEDYRKPLLIDLKYNDPAALVTALQSVKSLSYMDIHLVGNYIVFRSKSLSKLPDSIPMLKGINVTLKNQSFRSWVESLRKPDRKTVLVGEEHMKAEITLDLKNLSFEEAMCAITKECEVSSWIAVTAPWSATGEGTATSISIPDIRPPVQTKKLPEK